jgi:hypothetical protein
MLRLMDRRYGVVLLAMLACCKRGSTEESTSKSISNPQAEGSAFDGAAAGGAVSAASVTRRAPFPTAVGRFRFGMSRSESSSACKESGGREDRRGSTSSGQPTGCSPVTLLGVKVAPVVDFCSEEACAIGLGLTGKTEDRVLAALKLDMTLSDAFGPPIFKKGASARPAVACDGNDDLLEESWFWSADGGGRESIVFTQYCYEGKVGAMLVHLNGNFAAQRTDEKERQLGSYLKALAGRNYE